MLVLGDKVDLKTVLHVVAVDRRLMESELSRYIVETIPAWCSILIHFDIELAGPAEFGERLDSFMAGVETSGALTLDSRLVTLPVLYGGSAGPDLELVAAANGLSTEETIRRLATGTHFVGMISFIPGQAN